MRRLLFFLPLLLALALAQSSGKPLPPVPDRTILIQAWPVPLQATDPDRRTVGALRYLGGWSLRTDEAAFGGLSGMVMGKGELIAVSDSGALVRIGLSNGQPDGRGWIGPLPRGCGDGLYKVDRDAEAITGEPGTSHFWISLERRNAICRLNGMRRSEAEVFPQAIATWAAASGGETLLRMPDGRFLMWSEARNGKRGGHMLLRFDRDPTLPGAQVEQMDWMAPKGFRPVDAALLPDGRIVVLHRRFTPLHWMESVLMVMDPATMGPGRIVRGTEIARIDGRLTRDNYEGVAVSREGGRTILWLIADDNFHFLQRTLLLKFALEG